MKNSNEVDKLLKRSLSSQEEPDARLIQQVKYRLNQEESIIMKKSKLVTSPFKAIAVAAVLVLLLCTTAMAAWMFLRSSEVAKHFGDETLSAAFDSEDAVNINATITSGDYTFTLIAVVTGEDITDLPYYHASAQPDRTYAVLAIQRTDGTPMTSTWDEEVSFMVSPLVKGTEPWVINIASMHGAYSETVVDGIVYRLIECDGVEMFADRGLYIGVCTDAFIESTTFLYDETTGAISVNPDYDGASAIFDLPLDASLANPELAEQYLKSLYNPSNSDATGSAGDTSLGDFWEDFWEFADSIDWDNAVPVESTFQKLAVDSDGYISYSWNLDGYGSGSNKLLVDSWFEDGKTVVYDIHRNPDEQGNQTAYAIQFTRVDDNTVTAVLVVPE